MGGWEFIEMVCRYVYFVFNYLIEYVRKIDDIFGDNVLNMFYFGIMEDIKKV